MKDMMPSEYENNNDVSLLEYKVYPAFSFFFFNRIKKNT
jgi:hypothetical protein